MLHIWIYVKVTTSRRRPGVARYRPWLADGHRGAGTRRRDASLHATMRCMLRSYLPLLLPVAAGATTFTVNDRGSAFASLHVKLQAGESMQAEPGALVKYSGDLRLGIRSSSSWLGRMFAGETPWTTSIRATSSPGECMLCPHSIGDIRILELASDEAICLSGRG